MKPVLFVTNHAPPFRVGAFTGAARARERRLRADRRGRPPRRGRHRRRRSDAVSRVVHPSAARRRAARRLRPLPRRDRRPVRQGRAPRAPTRAHASGGSRSSCGRRSGRHPRTPAHALSYLPLRHIYRHADAIATYGPHVSAYVRTKHPHGPVFEAPQSRRRRVLVGAPATPERHGDFQILFAGRPAPEKGFDVLRRGRRRRRGRSWSPDEPGARRDLRNLYAGSDVVVVPSVPTRDFLEPWGLVVNEAFHQGVPVIATDAVGAAAGGLVQHERTGLVVPAGDADALASRPAPPARRPRAARAARRERRGATSPRYTPRSVGGGHVPRARRRAKGLLA